MTEDQINGADAKQKADREKELLSWTFSFRAQEPAKFAGLVVCIVAALAMVYFTSPAGTGTSWTMLAAVLLAAWLLPFFVPVTYELSHEGAAVFYSGLRISFKPWSHYTRCVYDEFGAALKTMVEDSWLDKFRGCFMRFPKRMENRAEIVEFIGGKLEIVKNTAYEKKPGRKKASKK
ncbi:hypothetical protein J7K50_07140 [bacterium]|nr:hypothetical protein [bacterium]